MARQKLGKKKLFRVSEKLGLPVRIAFANSEWGHGWIECFTAEDTSFLINAKTGDFTQLYDRGQAVTSKPVWRKVGCCA